MAAFYPKTNEEITSAMRPVLLRREAPRSSGMLPMLERDTEGDHRAHLGFLREYKVGERGSVFKLASLM